MSFGEVTVQLMTLLLKAHRAKGTFHSVLLQTLSSVSPRGDLTLQSCLENPFPLDGDAGLTSIRVCPAATSPRKPSQMSRLVKQPSLCSPALCCTGL